MSDITQQVICVFRRDNQILVREIYDKVEKTIVFRPLGGAINFGEYSQMAVMRHMTELLQMNIVNLQGLGMLENVYTYNGEKQHEIVFIYEAGFADYNTYDQDKIKITQGDYTFEAEWVGLAEFRSGDVSIVPEQLLDFLQDVNTIPLMPS